MTHLIFSSVSDPDIQQNSYKHLSDNRVLKDVGGFQITVLSINFYLNIVTLDWTVVLTFLLFNGKFPFSENIKMMTIGADLGVVTVKCEKWLQRGLFLGILVLLKASDYLVAIA